MAEKKDRRNRRAYLRDFQPGVGGDYVYTGAFRRFAGDGAAWRGWRLRTGGACLAAALALFAAGFLPATGSTDRFYVILPFLAAITAAFVSAWKTVRLLAAGETVRAYVYEATAPKLPGWALAGALACGAALAAELVHVALFGFAGKPAAALGFLALLTAALAAFLLLRRYARAAAWNEQK